MNAQASPHSVASTGARSHLSTSSDRRFAASRVLSILLHDASTPHVIPTATTRAQIRRAMADLESALTIEANAASRLRVVRG
ncbi:hypothetical protein HLH34_04275 [Gluconacetobacter azotocaptans]|uniref:Uncharacterized protein n=1 Tax=Gluconacetobacter azotocaptans TaxID=142834 RepID=A0A7W4PD03_9PROT|nr:hypothetical protein [Gluconacetobacter azotocaptans]MBB2189180.1 hypothetical protein [Gluconacetobacter azotocaptans]GBQ32166.1 hypothetical protein AA13594_2289 [Gluconacetobacter azotocaptans DSM 13594]